MGVIGNDRGRVLPIWELEFDLAPGAPPIATANVKPDPEYQHRHGVSDGPAKGLIPPLERQIHDLLERICRTLGLDGYARIDFDWRPTAPRISWRPIPIRRSLKSRSSPRSAQHDGLKYPDLLNRILALGLNRAKYGSAEA